MYGEHASVGMNWNGSKWFNRPKENKLTMNSLNSSRHENSGNNRGQNLQNLKKIEENRRKKNNNTSIKNLTKGFMGKIALPYTIDSGYDEDKVLQVLENEIIKAQDKYIKDEDPKLYLDTLNKLQNKFYTLYPCKELLNKTTTNNQVKACENAKFQYYTKLKKIFSVNSIFKGGFRVINNFYSRLKYTEVDSIPKGSFSNSKFKLLHTDFKEILNDDYYDHQSGYIKQKINKYKAAANHAASHRFEGGKKTVKKPVKKTSTKKSTTTKKPVKKPVKKTSTKKTTTTKKPVKKPVKKASTKKSTTKK